MYLIIDKDDNRASQASEFYGELVVANGRREIRVFKLEDGRFQECHTGHWEDVESIH